MLLHRDKPAIFLRWLKNPSTLDQNVTVENCHFGGKILRMFCAGCRSEYRMVGLWVDITSKHWIHTKIPKF
jgi:hypothetical protein